MISAGDFRNGITIEVDSNIFQSWIITFTRLSSFSMLNLVKEQLLSEPS